MPVAESLHSYQNFLMCWTHPAKQIKNIWNMSVFLKELFISWTICLSHPVEEILKLEAGNIFVRHLSPNVAADIQLMDQNVIQNFKTIYRRNLLLKLIEEEYDNFFSFWKSLIVLEEIDYIDAGWNLVKTPQLKNHGRQF